MPDYIISAHGGRFSNQQRNLVIPNGSSIVFYVRDEEILPNRAGYRILAQLEAGNVQAGEIYQTVTAGQSTYDYSCWYASEFASACGIYQVGSQVRVASLANYSEDNPLYLSTILAGYPNARIYWLACREVSDPDAKTIRVNSPGSFLTAPKPDDIVDPSEIPGAGALGFGFNSLGTYGLSSLTRAIFTHQVTDKTEWTYPPTGITYDVPDNTSVLQNTNVTGSSQVFDGRQQFQNYFAAQAGISGSYGGFSAEFNAAFSKTFSSDQSYYYCTYDAEYSAWNLAVTDQSSAWLSPGFVNDPDVRDLPTVFTDENRDKFFAVFRKFGTHYVAQVTVGGSLNYYLGVEKSFTSDSTTVEADVALEYDAVFISASAKASMEWNQLTENWANSRVATVKSVGGDTSILSGLDPKFGDSDKGLFDRWSEGVMKNPSVIGYQLRSLDLLFSGDKGVAVRQAIKSYMNGAIIVTANADYTPKTGPGGGNFTTSSMVMANGVLYNATPPEDPPTPYTAYGWVFPISGYQIVLLDPKTLDPILSYIYYQDWSSPAAERQIYDDMMEDINEATQDDYIAIVAGFAIDLMNYPTAAFSQWMMSCGAAMSGWRKYIGFTGSPGFASYVLIGQKGLQPGNAQESFAAATDWMDYPYSSTCDVSAIVLQYADSNLRLAGKAAYGAMTRWRETVNAR